MDDDVKMSAHFEMQRKYREVFESPVGKDVLAHICEMGHVHAVCHVRGDSHETAHREGERGLALAILAMFTDDMRTVEASLARRNSLRRMFATRDTE